MATELEKPGITEVQVRMDCNGCVQKIKKALHGINGIYEVYIDFPHQKITIVGRADPEKIVKAIKKTRKSAVICSHTEQQPKPSEQPPPPPESSSPAPPDEAEETAKAKDSPPVAPKNQPAADEEKQSPETAEMQTADQTSKPKEDNLEEVVHVIYHYPPHYGYTQQWNNSQPRAEPPPSPICSEYRQEPPPPPIYVSHSYNSYKPSPHVTRYDQYVHSSPPTYTHYGRPDEHYDRMMAEDYYHHTDDYHNGNIDSVFSEEENPNSCTIV